MIPQPQQDSILIREHLYRDSSNLDVVLKPDKNFFIPLTEGGLGHFNYKLVDPNEVFEIDQKDKRIYKSVIKLIEKVSLDKILLVIIILLCIGLIFTSIFKNGNFDKIKYDKNHYIFNEEDVIVNDHDGRIFKPNYNGYNRNPSNPIDNSEKYSNFQTQSIPNNANFDMQNNYMYSNIPQPVVVNTHSLQSRLRID